MYVLKKEVCSIGTYKVLAGRAIGPLDMNSKLQQNELQKNNFLARGRCIVWNIPVPIETCFN